MIGRARAPFVSASSHAKGIVYGVLSALSVTGYVLVNRYVYSHYGADPYDYAVTFAVAGGLFAVMSLLLRRVRRGDVTVTNTTAKQLLVISVIGGLAMALVAIGQNFTTAVNTGIIMTFSIVSTSLFSMYILKERFTGMQLRLLIVMFVGLYLGIVGLHIVRFHAGDLIVLLAMVLLGFNNTFSKLIIKKHDGNFVADVRLTISAALIMSVGFAVLGPDVLVTTAGLWPVLAGFFLWTCIRTFYTAIHYIGANHTIVLNNSQIFFTALAGVVLLAEPYDLIKFLGSALVLVSIYFISKR